MKILFVCTGNTCRSPMAELIASSLIKDCIFDSAGVFAPERNLISENARMVLLENDHNPKNFSSKRVTPEILKNADLILTMTKEQREILKSFFLEEKDKIFTLKEYNSEGENHQEISDPFGGTIEKYRKIFFEIEKEIRILNSRLKNNS